MMMGANKTFSCSCASSADEPHKHKRPTMETLHQLIQNRQWDKVQDSIRLDASVAMRVDDSAEEDCWVDEARRRWVQRQSGDDDDDETETELRHSFALMKMKNQCKPSSTEENDGNPPMQLRYWVGNGGNNNNNNNSAAYKLRMMTLLHSLCRLDFSQDGDGSENDDDDIAMAIQTAEMIISTSHNEHQPCCPCQYCPPMFFPAVSKGIEEDEEENDREREDKYVLHSSVLTVPDKMGGTPLHELTSCGSHHIELIKALFRGCAPININRRSGRSQRPTAYDLLAAPNDHGSTPLHFIAECCQTYDGVLRYVLEQCPLSVDSNNDENLIHPSMIGDNEGDLPLHYALSNCAPPECIEILTVLGDKRSTMVPNSRHQLPIDLLIEWYAENSEDFFEKENTDSDDSDEEGSDEDDESSGNESHSSEDVITDNNDQLSAEIASVMAASNVSRPIEGDSTSAWALLERNNVCGDFLPIQSLDKCYLCPRKSVNLVMQGMLSADLSDFWDSNLWKQMIVLIVAAVEAIVESSRFPNKNDGGSYSSVLQSSPLHAAVIATKYAHFPAFALAMAAPIDSNYRNEMAATYFLGFLPLHLACGDISSLLDSGNSCEKQYQNQQNPSTDLFDEIVRFNTNELKTSLVQYVLLLCPEAARIPTKDHGELPLHLFLQDEHTLWDYLSKKKNAQAFDTNDISFDPLERTPAARVSPYTPRCTTPWGEIKSLLSACPEALSTPSMTNHLYPFQQAATASHSLSSDEDDVDARLVSLENTYRLILEDPSVVYRNV